MDLEKVYYDLEGNECNILEAVRRSPEWAANRIQAGEAAIEKLEAQQDDAPGMCETCGEQMKVSRLEYCPNCCGDLFKE